MLGNGRKRFVRYNDGATGNRCSLSGPCDSYVMQQKLFGAVFSLRSLPRIYNEEQLRLRDGLETGVSRSVV
jgi:hypothetical protein